MCPVCLATAAIIAGSANDILIGGGGGDTLIGGAGKDILVAGPGGDGLSLSNQSLNVTVTATVPSGTPFPREWPSA